MRKSPPVPFAAPAAAMSTVAWIGCLTWIGVTFAAAARGALRGLREGRGHRAAARLKSPTIYLFAAYLLIAAWVTPRSPGESTSPLLWLALVLPLAYALATLSAIGAPRRAPAAALALALLHGGAVVAASAIVLALRLAGLPPRLAPALLDHNPLRETSRAFRSTSCDDATTSAVAV